MTPSMGLVGWGRWENFESHRLEQGAKLLDILAFALQAPHVVVRARRPKFVV